MPGDPATLYTASDLNWSLRLRSALAALGAEPRRIESNDDLDAALEAGPVGVLVVDLEAGEPSFDAIGHLRRRARQRNHPSPLILAFAPHVDRSGLARAREVGADEALPRGAILRRLERLAAGDPPGAPPDPAA